MAYGGVPSEAQPSPQTTGGYQGVTAPAPSQPAIKAPAPSPTSDNFPGLGGASVESPESSGTAEVAPVFSENPIADNEEQAQAFVQQIPNAASQSFQSAVDGVSKILAGGTPAEGLEAGAQTEAGVAGIVFSPLAPMTNLISQAVNYAGSQLANTPYLQKYGNDVSTLPNPNPGVQRVLTALQNLGSVAMGILGAKPGEPNVSPIVPAELETVAKTPEVQEALKEVVTAHNALTPEEQSTVATHIDQTTTAQPEETPTEEPAAPTKPRSTTQTLKPVQGTGDLKARGLSQGIEASAIENKLTDTFGDLPEYQQIDMKDQAAKAADLVTSDPDTARAIAMGEKAAPKGLLPESVMVAVEHQATTAGDVDTLKSLANSKLASSATTMGQRIRALGERDTASPVDAIRQVQDARAEALKSRGIDVGKSTDDAVASARTEIQKAVKSTPRPSWEDFVNSLTCAVE